MTEADQPVTSLWMVVEPAVGWTLVGVAGVLDHTTVGDLRECLDRLLSAGQTRIALDTAALRFCDSGGIRCLAGAWRRARDAGGDLLMVRPSEQVRWMLTVTGLARHMTSVEMLPAPWPAPGTDADLPAAEAADLLIGEA